MLSFDELDPKHKIKIYNQYAKYLKLKNLKNLFLLQKQMSLLEIQLHQKLNLNHH